ncbi:MAG TPA: hypothetical protein VK539_16445 [Myxococcaceae bacterium]|nr:hypothetical protein [Myxococcaceae bacterium]
MEQPRDTELPELERLELPEGVLLEQMEDATPELRVHTQGLELIYQRDDEKRTVTLLDFAVTDAEP